MFSISFRNHRDEKKENNLFTCVIISSTARASYPVKPGFRFFLRSVKNRPLVSRAHASLVHAHGTLNLQKLSSWKASSSDSLISAAMKSDTNEHTVRGRPRSLSVFGKGRSASLREINLRANILSELIKNHLNRVIPKELSQPGLSALQLDKKHLQICHGI